MKVGERVYHRRNNDELADEGYCQILEIGPIKANVLWEEDRKTGIVEVRDLMTEADAKREGL
jgi:hypothetical protein